MKAAIAAIRVRVLIVFILLIPFEVKIVCSRVRTQALRALFTDIGKNFICFAVTFGT